MPRRTVHTASTTRMVRLQQDRRGAPCKPAPGASMWTDSGAVSMVTPSITSRPPAVVYSSQDTACQPVATSTI